MRWMGAAAGRSVLAAGLCMWLVCVSVSALPYECSQEWLENNIGLLQRARPHDKSTRPLKPANFIDLPVKANVTSPEVVGLATGRIGILGDVAIHWMRGRTRKGHKFGPRIVFPDKFATVRLMLKRKQAKLTTEVCEDGFTRFVYKAFPPLWRAVLGAKPKVEYVNLVSEELERKVYEGERLIRYEEYTTPQGRVRTKYIFVPGVFDKLLRGKIDLVVDMDGPHPRFEMDKEEEVDRLCVELETRLQNNSNN